MTEELEFKTSEGGNTLRNVAIGFAVVYVIFSLYFTYSLNARLADMETKLAAAQQKLVAAEGDIKSTNQVLAERVGLTQKQIEQKAAALRKQQKEAETRLAEEQKKQLGAVTGEISGVRTEVGGVRTEAAALKSDLESTKAKLERAIGDLGVQSGLIATTREDLGVLRQRGERNYYEFTLAKNARVPVSTVSLQLKKADRKKGRFTLNVLADDKTIEKKDKNLNEPVQFYTGRDRVLYELVVFAVDKDKVMGYLATPKSAPQPVVNR